MIYTNYHEHCWKPAEIQKDRNGWGINMHFVHFTNKGMKFVSDEPRIYLRKYIEGNAEVIDELRQFGIEFVVRLYGSSASVIDLKNYEVRAVYVRPEDYETHIAAKVHNLYQQKKAEKEIPDWKFKSVMQWYNIVPGAIQKLCCNEVAVSINRPLSEEEETAFAPPGSADLDRLYTTRLVLRSDNVAYENRLGHVWMPGKIVIEDWDDTNFYQFDGENVTIIKPEQNQRIFICKVDLVGRAVSACKEHKIPYISHKIPYFSYQFLGTGLYLLPQDYKMLMGRVHNTFDPNRPVLKELDRTIVQKMIAQFPAAVESLMSQKTWLHLFWNALAIEHNRPLSELEKQSLVPEKSSVVQGVLAANRVLDMHVNAAETALEEIRRLTQTGTYRNNPQAEEPTRKVANSYQLMSEALYALKCFSE